MAKLRAWPVVVLVGWCVVLLVGCTAPPSTPPILPTAPASTPSAASAATPTLAVTPPTGPPIRLTCHSQTSKDQAPGALGVTSPVWGGAPSLDLSNNGGIELGAYTFVKSILVVAPDVPAGSTVTVSSPASARIFATDWPHWGRQVTPEQVIGGARSTIVVSDCGDKVPQMWPSGLVVAGPSCVTITITRPGSPAKTATLKVPVARECP